MVQGNGSDSISHYFMVVCDQYVQSIIGLSNCGPLLSRPVRGLQLSKPLTDAAG